MNTLKKLISTICAISMIIAMVGVMSVQAANAPKLTVALDKDPSTLKNGDTLNMSVSLAGMADIYGDDGEGNMYGICTYQFKITAPDWLTYGKTATQIQNTVAYNAYRANATLAGQTLTIARSKADDSTAWVYDKSATLINIPMTVNANPIGDTTITLTEPKIITMGQAEWEDVPAQYMVYQPSASNLAVQDYVYSNKPVVVVAPVVTADAYKSTTTANSFYIDVDVKNNGTVVNPAVIMVGHEENLPKRCEVSIGNTLLNGDFKFQVGFIKAPAGNFSGDVTITNEIGSGSDDFAVNVQ